MSKVYSFRLSTDNPREAQAREVIEAWVSDGYSLRYIVTEALIFFCEKDTGSDVVYSLLLQIKDIVTTLDLPSTSEPSEKQNISILTQSFTDAVKKTAKLGLSVKN